MSAHPRLIVRDLRVRAVSVPMPLPLQTSNGTIGIAPLALIDLYTDAGVTGTAYLFCYTPLVLKPVVQMLGQLSQLIQGEPVSPIELDRKLRSRFRLLGCKGVVGMALAGIDMALWDALARAQGIPLARALGGELRRIPAYNSCGLGMIGPQRAAEQARHLVEPGFRAIKLRLGYADAAADLAAVRAVRKAVGDEIVLMTDYNQALSVPEAAARIRVLDGEGLYWIEEPALAEDYAGHARIRDEARTAIQMGENWWGTHEMAACVALGGSDYVMPDAMKIGGVTGWLKAAAIADAAGSPLSSHLFPELSVHLLAVSPSAHWLEYVDWATPILQEPLEVHGGHATPPDAPGCNLTWDEAAVDRYLVV